MRPETRPGGPAAAATIRVVMGERGPGGGRSGTRKGGRQRERRSTGTLAGPGGLRAVDPLRAIMMIREVLSSCHHG